MRYSNIIIAALLLVCLLGSLSLRAQEVDTSLYDNPLFRRIRKRQGLSMPKSSKPPPRKQKFKKEPIEEHVSTEFGSRVQFAPYKETVDLSSEPFEKEIRQSQSKPFAKGSSGPYVENEERFNPDEVEELTEFARGLTITSRASDKPLRSALKKQSKYAEELPSGVTFEELPEDNPPEPKSEEEEWED